MWLHPYLILQAKPFPCPHPSSPLLPPPSAPVNASPVDRSRHRCVTSRVYALSCTKWTQHRNVTADTFCDRPLLIYRLQVCFRMYECLTIVVSHYPSVRVQYLWRRVTRKSHFKLPDCGSDFDKHTHTHIHSLSLTGLRNWRKIREDRWLYW